jgi:hypothetical protein
MLKTQNLYHFIYLFAVRAMKAMHERRFDAIAQNRAQEKFAFSHCPAWLVQMAQNSKIKIIN